MKGHVAGPRRRGRRPLPMLVSAGVLLLFLAACDPGSRPTPMPSTLEIGGSTTMGPVLEALAAAFQEQNATVVLDVQEAGSGAGLAELRMGQLDVAAVSWLPVGSPTPEGMQTVPLARDAIAIIVHPSNPISNVTFLQLRSLYVGELVDWAALGGPTGQPDIISREEGSGTRDAFESMAMENQGVTLNARVMPSNKAVVDYVASHRLATGYVSVTAVDGRVRAVPLEGVPPSLETTKSGQYPLTRLLYVVTARPPSLEAESFIAFATSRQAQSVIARFHVPVR